MGIRKNTINSLGFLIIGAIVFTSALLWFFHENLEIWKDKDISYVDNAEWALLSTTLILKLQQASQDGLRLQDKIYFMLGNDYLDDFDQVADDLDHFFEPDNPIRFSIARATENYLFDNIVSFNTDSFSIFGEILFQDDSGDCAGWGSYRTFLEEEGMHANPEMGLKNVFYRISIGDIENYGTGAIHKPLFFQFEDHPYGLKIKKDYGPDYEAHKDKKAWLLETYDLSGLKKSFYKTKDWRKVFLAFEFVTPTYLFHKSDLAGRPYIMDGLRTDIPRLSIQTTFNFKTVIDNMPELRSELTKLEIRRTEINTWFETTQISLLLLLIMDLLFGIFAIFYTEKITRANYGRDK